MIDKQFSHMQKLAFGKSSETMNESALKSKIKELVMSSLGEAKKKKEDKADVAPQEDVNINVDEPTDTVSPTSGEAMDIDPKVKSIQDSLQKAYANAKALGDEKLATQIGNTLTMLLRDQVLGGGQQQQ